MQSETQLREHSELAQKRKLIELLTALKNTPQKRNGQQASRIAQFLASIHGINKLTPGLLNRFVHHCFGVEFFDGQIIYRASDSAAFFYIIVVGNVVLTDVKDKGDEDDDHVIARLGPKDWFGHEEILSNSRRAFTASALKGETFCIRVPVEEYKKGLEDIHMLEFDDKVEFISSLAPMRPLKAEIVRKLAPCFSISEFKAKDVVVRQGEKADAMYAIRSGSCAVVVDPHYKNTEGKLGTLEPGKTLRIVTLNPGAIIGDITVLATVTKRTASVIANVDLVVYKICRSVFLRRIPPDQLEILRRIANEKITLTDSKVKNKPATKALQERILHGHNLRELSKLPAKDGLEQPEPEEYQELIHLLRRYKRSPVPKTNPELPGAPPAASQNLSSPMVAVGEAKGLAGLQDPSVGTGMHSSPTSPSGSLSPTKFHTVAARLGAELDLEHALATGSGGGAHSSPESADKRERGKLSSPRPAALLTSHSSGSGPGSPAQSRSGTSTPTARGAGLGAHALSVTMPMSRSGNLHACGAHVPPSMLPREGAGPGRGSMHELPGNMYGHVVPRGGVLQGGGADEEGKEQQTAAAAAAGGKTEGAKASTGSKAVSAALAHHLGLDTKTGLMRIIPSQPPPPISFATPRKDVHKAQAAQHATRSHLPGLAHLQGPPLSAHTDIQGPLCPALRTSADGTAGQGPDRHSDPGRANLLLQEADEPPPWGKGGGGDADKGAHGGSGMMQGRRLQSAYHTRPMSTSNTLRTIPPGLVDNVDARYGSLTHRHTHHHTHPLVPYPSHAHAHAHQQAALQTHPVVHPRGSLLTQQLASHTGRPLSATLPQPLTLATQSTHTTHPLPLHPMRPTSAAALLTAPLPVLHHPPHMLSPHMLSPHLTHQPTQPGRPSLPNTAPLPICALNNSSTLPAPLLPSPSHPLPQLQLAAAPHVPHGPQQLGPPQQPLSTSPADLQRQQQQQQQQAASSGGQSGSIPHCEEPSAHPVLHADDDHVPTVFHNQDPLGPVAYTHRPTSSLSHGPVKPSHSLSKLKASVSGPCVPPSATARSLNKRGSTCNGEADDDMPGSQACMPDRATFDAGGWSSSNLDLPQHRTLAAAGGLQRYLRQLQYNKELEKLQAMQKNAGRLDAALDKMAGPLLESKSNPVLRKGTVHYRPSIPKALL